MATMTMKRKAEPSALDLVAGLAAAGGAVKGKAAKLVFNEPSLDADIGAYIEADQRVAEWESKRLMHADRIRTAAAKGRRVVCRREGKVEASVLVNGRLTLTQKNQFSPIDPAQLPRLTDAFGEADGRRYFLPQLELSLTPEAAADEATLKALIDALGIERFKAAFKVVRKVKVSEEFYNAWTLRPEVEAKAAPFLADETIKPYSPSLRVA